MFPHPGILLFSIGLESVQKHQMDIYQTVQTQLKPTRYICWHQQLHYQIQYGNAKWARYKNIVSRALCLTVCGENDVHSFCIQSWSDHKTCIWSRHESRFLVEWASESSRATTLEYFFCTLEWRMKPESLRNGSVHQDFRTETRKQHRHSSRIDNSATVYSLPYVSEGKCYAYAFIAS